MHDEQQVAQVTVALTDAQARIIGEEIGRSLKNAINPYGNLHVHLKEAIVAGIKEALSPVGHRFSDTIRDGFRHLVSEVKDALEGSK